MRVLPLPCMLHAHPSEAAVWLRRLESITKGPGQPHTAAAVLLILLLVDESGNKYCGQVHPSPFPWHGANRERPACSS